MPTIGVAILTVSDSAAQNAALDKSGPFLTKILNEYDGGDVFKVSKAQIVPDERQAIERVVREWAENDEVNWVITSGGTGFGVRDQTPEALSPLIERQAPGIVHLLLQSSIVHTPLAALSRPIAGTIGSTLLVTLPGSPKAVKENIEALLQGGVVLHALDLIQGGTGKQVHKNLGVPDRGDTSASVASIAAQSHPSKTQFRAHSHHHQHQHHHHGGHHHEAPVPKSHDPALGATARLRKSPYPLISLDEALQIVDRECGPLEIVRKKVDVSLRGCTLAEDIVAPHALPALPTTNVDGYAVKSSYKAGTYRVLTPQTHSLSGDREIPDGFIYRINTGSPLPRGTDAVIMVEDTELVSTKSTLASAGPSNLDTGELSLEEETIKMLVEVRAGENVRAPGSDVRKGDLALEAGTVIGSVGGEVGTLAFVGRKEVLVYRKPVVAIMSTGNEIIDLQSNISMPSGSDDDNLKPGRDGWTGIYDTNRPSLQAALEGMGYEVVDLGVVGDDVKAHTDTMKKGLSIADVLLTTGGSSMGSSDLLKPVIERHLSGTVHFGRVSVKPGKPTTFATVPSPPSTVQQPQSPNVKRIFALPGNPASALVMFHIFVVPALRRLAGWPHNACNLPRIRVKILEDMHLDPRPEFHRVYVRVSGDGLVASSTGGQRSSRIASLSGANGLIALPGLTAETGDRLLKGQIADCVIIGEIQVDSLG